MQDFLRRTTDDILTIMKYSTYIYGRTLKIDFREICSPKDGLSSKSVSLIKELINTDVPSNGDINRLRYLFVRERHQVLFGVGFNHCQFLDERYWNDISKIRTLRSFVGIVVDNEEFSKQTSIPVDFDFFKKLYLNYIPNIWELEDRPRNREVIIAESCLSEQSDDWCKLDGNVVFNSDDSYCRFFPPSDEESIIHSLKKCQSSVAIGLNVECHVMSAYRRFNHHIPNAVCLDTRSIHDYIFVVSGQEQEEPIIMGNRSQQRIKIPQDNKMSNKVSEVETNESAYKPAILSSLRKSVSLNRDSIDKKQSMEGDLMSIDWGDDTIESSKVSNIITNSDNFDETIEEGDCDFMKDSSDLAPMEFSAKKANTDDKPKKVLSPKAIAVCVMIILLCLTLFLVIQKTRHIPSGKEVQEKKVQMTLDSLTFDSIEHQSLQK